MALTTHQAIVLRAMQRMTPSQQSAVVRFAATLSKKRKRKNQKQAKQSTPTNGSIKTPDMQKHLKHDHPNARNTFGKPSKLGAVRLNQPKLTPLKTGSFSGPQNKQGTAPPKLDTTQECARPDPKDNEWLFSENRRREPTPRPSDPSGQKWALNPRNHRPR